MNVLNITACKFVQFRRLPEIRAVFEARYRELGLRAGAVIAEESVSVYLAGAVAKIERLRQRAAMARRER